MRGLNKKIIIVIVVIIGVVILSFSVFGLINRKANEVDRYILVDKSILYEIKDGNKRELFNLRYRDSGMYQYDSNDDLICQTARITRFVRLLYCYNGEEKEIHITDDIMGRFEYNGVSYSSLNSHYNNGFIEVYAKTTDDKLSKLIYDIDKDKFTESINYDISAPLYVREYDDILYYIDAEGFLYSYNSNNGKSVQLDNRVKDFVLDKEGTKILYSVEDGTIDKLKEIDFSTNKSRSVYECDEKTISGFTYSENNDQIILRMGKTGTVVGSNSLCIYPSSVIMINDKGEQKKVFSSITPYRADYQGLVVF